MQIQESHSLQTSRNAEQMTYAKSSALVLWWGGLVLGDLDNLVLIG